MSFELKEKVKKARESVTGLSQARILSIDIDQEKDYIETFTGRKVVYPAQLDNAALNRGNPYMASGSMTSMDSVDAYIESIVRYGKQ